ncbi:hypothetical protein Tco_0741583, partial [Tanacetum coccineum]
LGHLREIFVSTLYSGRLQYGDALILNVDGLVLEDVDPTKVKVNRINLSRKSTEKTLRLEPLGDEWSSNGPLLEILMGSLLFHGIVTENLMEGSIESELQVNYNNIHKVLWEPFLEPWKFQVSLRREHGKSALQNSPIMTDVHLESAMNLNINVAFRTFDMIKDKDAWDLMELNGTNKNAHTSR